MTDVNTGVNVRLAKLGQSVWTVLAIADSRGKTFADELRAADPADEDSSRMLMYIEEFVPDNGPPAGTSLRCTSLGGGLFEFRHGRLRVLWFYDTNPRKARRLIVCSHMFAKKGQRSKGTPPKQIKEGRRLLQRYAEEKRAGRAVLEP